MTKLQKNTDFPLLAWFARSGRFILVSLDSAAKQCQSLDGNLAILLNQEFWLFDNDLFLF